MNYEQEPKMVTATDIDTIDSSSNAGIPTATKKDSVLERINKRNKDRQNYLDVKLEQRNKENLQFEGADYFSQSFADRAREIETLIQNITESTTKKNNAADLANNELTRLFADVTIEIQELQRYLTTSTIFLTDFKIKACQNVLTDLSNNCEETRLKLMPKKKFGFSGRKVAPKAILNPRVNSAGGDKLDNINKKSVPTNAFTWTLSNRKNEHIYLSGDEVNGKDITISKLTNCLVEIQGHAGSLQISNAINCTFLCGPIARSLFAEHCHDSTFALACQQLRLHSSTTCRIYLHVTCRAIIEDCKHIEVATYCYDYPGIEIDFEKSGLDKSQNNYTDIADFNWLSPDVPSPNWQLLKDCATPNWSELRYTFKEKNVGNSLL